jgi:hypothetical protein
MIPTYYVQTKICQFECFFVWTINQRIDIISCVGFGDLTKEKPGFNWRRNRVQFKPANPPECPVSQQHSITVRPEEKANQMSRKDFRLVRDTFANDDGLPFGRLLKRDHVVGVLEDEGHEYRQRVFCPLVTLWAWLSQCLSQDKSLNEAVSRILAHRVANGLPACSASSASYADARSRFPLQVMSRLAKEIGCSVHGTADNAWHWRGRELFLADGTTLSMPDTAENQLEFPRVKTTVAGLGFPIMRAVALISFATGAVALHV